MTLRWGYLAYYITANINNCWHFSAGLLLWQRVVASNVQAWRSQAEHCTSQGCAGKEGIQEHAEQTKNQRCKGLTGSAGFEMEE